MKELSRKGKRERLVSHLTRHEYVGAGVYSAGNAFKNTFTANFGSLITASFLGLDKSTYSIVSTVLMVLSIWDIVNDVIIGNYIDKRKGTKRLGKFKPIILIAALPCMLIPIFQWLPLMDINPALPQWFKAVYVCVLYFFFDMAGTFFNAATNGIMARITPSNRERGNLQGIIGVIATPCGMAATVVMMVIPFIFPNHNEPTQYFIGNAIMMLLGMPMSLYFLIKAKERIEIKEDKPPKLKSIYKDIIKNRPLMSLMMSELLAFGFFFTGFAYVFVCNDVLRGLELNFFGMSFEANTGTLMTLISVICMPTTFLSLFLAPIIRRHVNDRTLYMATRVFSFACYIVMFSITFPASGYSPESLFWRIVIPYAVHGLTTGFYNIMPNLMMFDSIDYGEWKFGRRSEATVSAVRNTMGRICSELTKWIGALLLVAIAYPTEDSGAEILPGTKDGLLIIFSLIPAVFALICCIPLFFYNYVGKNKEKIEAELRERRALIAAGNEGKSDLAKPDDTDLEPAE